MKNVPLDLAKSVAAVFGLAGFAVACVSGLAWGMSATGTLWRGLVALTVCYVVGTIAGSVLEKLVREVNTQYEKDRPIPKLIGPGGAGGQATTGGGGGGGGSTGGEGDYEVVE